MAKSKATPTPVPTITVERVQTGVRIEKRMLKVLKTLAEYYDLSLGDLLEGIVEPSKAISDQYAAIVIRKKNGEMVTGRVANLNGPSVSLVEDMLEPGNFTSVRRQDIESIETAKVSMMPPGLLNSLKPDEIQDLIAYLLSRGDSKHRMFR